MNHRIKRVYPIEENCMGCRLCEVACAIEHSEFKDPIMTFFNGKPQSFTTVEVDGAFTFSLNCRHCDEPYCVEACITGAMHKEPDGRVVVYEDICVGCYMCVVSCPWGAVNPKEGAKKAAKCDLCPDRELPACVQACPNRALVFDTTEELVFELPEEEEEPFVEG